MKRYQLSESVIHEHVEDEAVVVAPHKATISALNETGNRILQIISKEQPSFDQIVEKIQSEYQVSQEEAEKDVRYFLDKLMENDLINEA